MITMIDLRNLINEDRAAYREAVKTVRAAVELLETVYSETRDGTPAETVAEYVERVAAIDPDEIGSDAVGFAADAIASMVNVKAWDGRISPAVKAWAESRGDSLDEESGRQVGAYSDRIHTTHLDQIAEAMMQYLNRPREEEETAAEIPEEDIDDAVAEAVAEEIAAPAPVDRAERIASRIAEYVAEYDAMPVESLCICIAPGNSKTGRIPNVSMPPILSCRGVCGQCGRHCYDGKAVLQYTGTAKARARNWSIWKRDHAAYFAQIATYCLDRSPEFFRYHSGGEIPDMDYFALMVFTARIVPGTHFLAFTKRHKLVADYIDLLAENGQSLPDNLQVVLSAWPGMPVYNPHGLPVSSPFPCDRPDGWQECPGNCEQCCRDRVGCWYLKRGDVVGFKYHGTDAAGFAETWEAWEDLPQADERRTAEREEAREA